MKQTFERIEKHLYCRQYQAAGGEWKTLHYASFVCRLKKKRRMLSLGSDLDEAHVALKRLDIQDAELHDFDMDSRRVRETESARDGKASPLAFNEWAEKYPSFDDVKRKRSLPDDLRMIRLHLLPFFSACLPTEFEREGLCRYVDQRSGQTLIRAKIAALKSRLAAAQSAMSCPFCGECSGRPRERAIKLPYRHLTA